MAGMHDRREFYRANPKMRVRLEAESHPAIDGRIRDVSLQGLFVTCATLLPLGTVCRVTIALDGTDDAAAIRGRAIVVRVAADGLALHVTRLDDRDSTTHLKNLVLYNTDDPARVQREIERWLGRGDSHTNGAHKNGT